MWPAEPFSPGEYEEEARFIGDGVAAAGANSPFRGVPPRVEDGAVDVDPALADPLGSCAVVEA